MTGSFQGWIPVCDPDMMHWDGENYYWWDWR